MMTDREKAIGILTHYLRAAFESAGLRYREQFRFNWDVRHEVDKRTKQANWISWWTCSSGDAEEERSR